MKADKIFTLATKQATHVAIRGLFLLLVVMFAECEVAQDNNQETAEEDFSITGTWELNELRFLSGQSVDVQTGNEYLWYRIFEDNGTYYVAEMANSRKRKPIKAHEMSEYFFMMSPYDTVYIEHGRMTDLTIMDNHTIAIDRGDYAEIYVKSDNIPAKRLAEIEQTVENALRPTDSRMTQYIVPLASTPDKTHFWTWIIPLVVIVFVVSLYVYYKVKAKRQPTITEKENEEEIKETPQREEKHEQTFIHSDYYLALRPRLYEGPTLKHDEWEELEVQMRSAYPMFFRRLMDMCQLSEVELRVCMLIKLGIPPSAIAIQTCREYSSISSIRSRLYFKLSGKKGGAKDLDSFILNL